MSNSDLHSEDITEDLSEATLDLFIEMGNKAADAAAEVIVHHYSCRRLHFSDKNGEGPVTEADKEAEETIVSILLNSFPSHAVFGEETKWRRPKDANDTGIPNFVWVVDPIDGTDSFIGRNCEFGILIALLYQGKPVLGIIDQPITKDRWIGVRGRKTTKNGREVSSSVCEDMANARVDVKSKHYSDNAEFAFDRIVPNVMEILHDGNCIAYGMLASGYVDLVVDCGLDCYDFLALIPIVEGAGGVITDWEGHELNWNVSPHSYTIPGGYRVLAAGNKVLHEMASLALLLN